MSNYFAIATVTATLQLILAEAVGVVNGARVSTDDPRKDDETSTPQVNVILYQISPHAAWRATDSREQAAVDLHYLLTFHGDKSRLEPQLLLGSVLAQLHDEPELTADRIRQAEEKAGFLSASAMSSNLALQDDPIRLTPVALTLDDLSKLWSSLFQAPYALSVAYQAGAVLIDREEAFVNALPLAR